MLHNRNCSGFSLVEMAIVIIIIGIIISAVSLSMPGLISSAKVKKCEALIAKAAYVLTTQLSLSGRVPCPDTDGDGFENRIDGGTADDPGDDSCSSDIGSLPWQTMGIGAGDDMWGTALRYGVYADLVQGTALTLCSTLGTAVAASASCNTAKLHTTSGADSANQAFIIVSAGPDEALDGLNSGTDPGFEPAGRIPAAGYDDLSATRTLTGLYGKLCRGSFQPGVTSGTAGEETYTNGCENSTDDDGDGITDCLDQDCWGEDPCMVKITTDTLPSGTLNSSYATTLAATDGMLPYAWSLTGNGGFVTDLVLNASTGQLSGTLDQCPGTYTIGVKVTDSTPAAANGPTSDTKSLDLTVTSDLAVSRISGDGSAVITWSDKDQSESFRAAGERIGAVTWSLNAGGATGFTTASAADDTGSIIKNGITTAGTYTFTLTATDASCPGNSAQIELTVTVTADGTPAPNPPGTILAEVGTLEFDTDDGGNPDIIHISGDVYAIAYTGASSDGWLKTVSISSDGTISSTIVDSYEFDTSRGEEPAIINVSGDTYAIAYRGNLSDGWLRTLDISAAGAISAIGGSDSHEFDSDDGDTPDILNVSGDIFAIVHRGNSNDGWLRTVDISAAGVISAVGGSDVYEYDISDGYDPDIIHIVNDIFAVAYRGDRDDGWMKTVQVSSSGVITPADVDSFEFDTDTGYEPCLLHKSGDIYIVAYRGDAYDGWLRSLDISSAGSISAVGGSDTYEFDASDGYEPVIVQVSGDIYAVAYRGPDDDGWLKTVNISDSGAITQSTISSYEFDANEANLPDMVHVSGNVFAIAYEGLDGVGWLKTVTIKQ